MLEQGVGVAQDHVEAARLFELAAAKGHKRARAKVDDLSWATFSSGGKKAAPVHADELRRRRRLVPSSRSPSSSRSRQGHMQRKRGTRAAGAGGEGSGER